MEFRKKHIKIVFLFAAIAWAIFWGILFVPIILNFINKNPNFAGIFTIPLFWVIKWIGYWISLFILGMVLTGKHAIRLSLAALFFATIWIILSPPLCISLQGNLLITPDNYSCLMGDDTLVSWMFSFIVPYGNSALYYLVYPGGVILFSLLFVLSVKKKEMWDDIIEKFDDKKIKKKN